MSWDGTTPSDNEDVLLGDNRIREFKQDVEYSLNIEHTFPVDSASPKTYHKIPEGGIAVRPLASATSNRLFYNTDTRTLQQEQSGAWVDITTNIPRGISFNDRYVQMVFCQATAPLGWATIYSPERYLRVVANNSVGPYIGGEDTFQMNSVVDVQTSKHYHNFITISFIGLVDATTKTIASGGTQMAALHDRHDSVSGSSAETSEQHNHNIASQVLPFYFPTLYNIVCKQDTQ